MKLSLTKLDTDYQSINPDGSLWILRFQGKPLSEVAALLNLKPGDRVILDAGEDFTITGTLDFKFSPRKGCDAWVAYGDWTTRVDQV